MRRTLILASALVTSIVHAEPEHVTSSIEPRAADQGIGAEMGIAAGGNVTPGGLRIAGHYLYQMSSQDWFDGVASFTYGGNTAGCYEDRMATMQCEHGLTAGSGLEIAATVRRMFTPQGAFQPFVRAGIGIAVSRYKADDVTGVAFPLHAGAGVRTRVSKALSIVAQADLAFGFGVYSQSLGAEAVGGMAITAGAEFDLR